MPDTVVIEEFLEKGERCVLICRRNSLHWPPFGITRGQMMEIRVLIQAEWDFQPKSFIPRN